jgi:hypothetical protein
MLGNQSFTDLGNKEKMEELESKLKELGYCKEANCNANTNTDKLTYHIYEIPTQIDFSVLSSNVITLLKEYSGEFKTRVAVSATKVLE